MAYGKKNKVSEDLGNYSICILGESGIGKTTLMVEVCEKLFGEDGYMIFNMGKEQGVDCIDGAIYEDIKNWKTFDAVTKDIIANKKTEYPDLRVIVLDTLDQMIDIAEPETVRLWNIENAEKAKKDKTITVAKTINQSWGGFGKGEEKLSSVVLDRIWQLQNVGVRVWYTAHVKTRSIVDPVTNQSYTTLSTNMQQNYFNAFKTKMHLVGVACIDREIEVENTGRKNIVTNKDITVNRVKAERRKIVFRDDNYSVDSKSRFANVVDEIPLDADELIKALQEAIKNSKRDRKDIKQSTPRTVKKEEVVVPEQEDELEDDLVDEIEDVEDTVEEQDEVDFDDLVLKVKELYKGLDKTDERKAQIASIIKAEGGGKVTSLSVESLQSILEI